MTTKKVPPWFAILGFTLLVGLANSARVEAGTSTDSFIAGYASAVLEREFKVEPASVRVEDGALTIRAEKLPADFHVRITRILNDIPGVKRVEILVSEQAPAGLPPARPILREGEVVAAVQPSLPLVLPQGKLFEALLADPRWPHFSMAYQYYTGDQELEQVGATSFGESLGLYRGRAPFEGSWQVDIQAGVFAIFDLDSNSLDLVNADYWIGFPLSYRSGRFSALLRVFHQSSHLGDEFLLRQRVDRVNLSYESIDAKLSYEFTDWLRLYGGGGYLFHKEPADLEPWSAQGGVEFKSPRTFAGEVLRPVLAADFQAWEERDWDLDLSIRAGVQLENPGEARQRRLLLTLEYFNGHSPNGQFYERAIEYIGLGTHFFF